MGDVGWTTWEELNRVPLDGTVRNYGWPCYEGAGEQPAYDALNVTTCESLYAAGTATPPYFTYNHAANVRRRRRLRSGRLVDLGGELLHRRPSSRRPTAAALFFGDYARNCIWVMPLGADGQPDPATAPSCSPAALPGRCS